MSIRSHLVVLVLAVALPFSAVVGMAIYSDFQHSISSAKNSLQTLTHTMVGNTGGKIASAREMLERIAARPMVRLVDPTNCDGALKDLLSVSPNYANLGYSDLDGLIVCSAVPQPDGKLTNIGKTPWFQHFLKVRGFTVGDPFIGPITGKWVSVLSVPIWDDRQEMVGAVHLPLDLKNYDPAITTEFLPDNSRYGFIGSDGVLIWRNVDPENQIGSRPGGKVIRRALAIRDGEFEELAIDGESRYFSVSPVPQTGWIAFVGVPASTIYAQAKRGAIFAGGISLIALVLTIMFAIAIWRRLAKPIAELGKAVYAVENGDLDVRVRIEGPQEVAAVAKGLNSMIQSLKRSIGQLQQAQSVAHLGYWDLDLANGRLEWSDELYRVFGVTPEAFVPNQERFIDLIHPDDRAAIQAWGSACVSGQRPGPLRFRCVWPDGSIRHIEGQGELETNAAGKPVRAHGTSQDITLRIHAEEAVAHSEALFRYTFKKMPAALSLQTSEGVILDCSESFCHETGYARDEVIGRNALELNMWVDPGQRVAMREALHRDGLITQLEFQMNRRDGSVAWMQMSANYIDVEGEPMLLSFAHDVSQRKVAENALRVSEQEFREMAEAMPQIVWVTRADGRSVFFNRRWAAYTGITMEESLGHNWSRPFHPEDQPSAQAAWQHAVATVEPYSVESRLRRADGAYRWWLIRGIPSIGADGSVLKWFGTCTDIHEMKLADNVIQQALKEKTALLKEVHHRVKNNLQVIASLLRLESRRSTMDDTKTVLREMQARIHAMALLHESLYRAGTFASVDLGSYLRQLSTQAFKAQATHSGAVQLELNLGSVQVSLDQAIPCGLLVNELISNCLKHAFPEGVKGQVRIELQRLDTAQQWCLQVSDTGVGLPPDFDERREGSLGLQLVSDLARQLDGALAITPNQGQGVAFAVNFQVMEPAPLVMPA